MFRDDRQASRVCKIFLSSVHLGSLWTEDGPTDRAVELFNKNGGPLSSGERVMLLFSFSVWNNTHSNLPVGHLFALDGERLALVGSFLCAAAQDSDAIDEWLEEHAPVLERPRTRPPGARPGGDQS